MIGINPILSQSRDVQYLSKLIFRSLLRVTPNFRVENDLVGEWSRINSTTYLIRLQDNILCHNGNPFTAHDVKFTIDGIKNLEADSIYKENVQHISNVEVIDDHIIRIYLAREVPFFEYMLTFPILSRETYDPYTLESLEDLPIGAGPFKIAEILDEGIRLERNAEEEAVINIKIYQEHIDLYNNLSRENIDLISTINIEFENYIGTIGFRKYIAPGREFDFLAINTNHRILSNQDLRRAINYAIDRNSVVYNAYKNKYVISTFPLAYGSYLYNSNNIDNLHNVTKAREILITNGWENRLEFELIVNEDHINRVMVAEIIREQLEQVGIRINVQRVNNSTFEKYLTSRNYQLLLTGNVVPLYPDLSIYFGEQNLFNYRNEEIRNLLAEINDVQDIDLLKEKYRRIIEIYNEDMPFISLYFSANILIVNNSVRGNITHNWHNIFYHIESWHKKI